MKSSEIRALPVAELKAKVNDLTKELFNLKLRHASNQLDNPLKLRVLRKDVARARTILAEKERGA